MAPPGTQQGRPLRLLSLDGGGIRGISELVILQEIMHRVKMAGNLKEDPRPADYFDMICGTSTGGLIAILLGRLRLSVPEAMLQYTRLAKKVFSDKKNGRNFLQDGLFKATNLENVIRGVLEDKLRTGGAKAKMIEEGSGGCKTFVCAMLAKNIKINRPYLFRTWEAAKNPSHNCMIWEACRATSAAPRFFKRMIINEEEYIDGSMGCNNPVEVLITEAICEFAAEAEISCILSIGTGQSPVSSVDAPKYLQKFLPTQLIDALKNMATSSDATAESARNRLRELDGLFHRLNVDKGLDKISLEEWDKLSDVKSHTHVYLDSYEVSHEIDEIVDSLLGKQKPEKTYILGRLENSVTLSLASQPPKVGVQSFPPRLVNRFVDREQPLEDMKKHLSPPVGSSVPAVCVLQGMGGCGKSQLALKYCQMTRDNDPATHVLWVDATSITTAQQSIASIVQKLSPAIAITNEEESLRVFKETLCTSAEAQQNWLLVFDNYDDRRKFGETPIRDLFPQTGHGSIIITTRSTDMNRLGHVLSVSDMTQAEALKLLFQISEAEESNANSQEAFKIVKRLGFHALAIDQAGAYIRSRNLELVLYLDHYDRRREKVLQELPPEWEYRIKSKEDPNEEIELSVFTTWELSFSQISGSEEERKDKERILTLSGFFHNSGIKETYFKTYASENDSWLSSCRQDNEFNVLEYQDILKELHKLSLLQSLQVNSTGSSFSLHPLIQDWVKLRLGLKAQQEYTIETTAMLCSYLQSIWNKNVGFSTKSFEESQILVAHVATTISNRKDFHIDQLCFRMYDDVISSFLLGNGVPYKPELTKELALLDLSHKEKLLGRKHPLTINAMNDLATSYSMFDEFDEAESLHKKALSLSQGLLGVERYESFAYLDDLAGCMLLQGKNEEAERLLQPQIPAAEEALGREHQHVLNLKIALANSLRNQGQYSKAEVLFRDVLAVQRETVGEANGDTLINAKSLSMILLVQGKLEEAETLYRQCLTVSTEILGDDPMTLKIMYDLGSVMVRNNSNISEAGKLFKQAFRGQDSALGSSHPETLLSLSSLGVALAKKGDVKAAEEAFGLLIERRESAAGPNYRVILDHIFTRGRLFKQMGDLSAAKQTFRRLISRQESALGPDHCDTLKSLFVLGITLFEKNDLNAAMQTMRLYVQRHDSKDPILGRNDPERLQALFVIGAVLQHKGDSGEAEKIISSLISLVQDGTGNELAMKDNSLGRRQEGTQDSEFRAALLRTCLILRSIPVPHPPH